MQRRRTALGVLFACALALLLSQPPCSEARVVGARAHAGEGTRGKHRAPGRKPDLSSRAGARPGGRKGAAEGPPAIRPCNETQLVRGAGARKVRRRCSAEDCAAMGRYMNASSGGWPLYCGRHKPPGCLNALLRACLHSGCTRRASFGDAGDRLRLFCSRHKRAGDTDLAAKLCGAEGCRRQAVYNLLDAQPRFCSTHKRGEMVDVKTRRCKFGEGCRVVPVFGRPGGPPIFCKLHKQPQDVDVVN